MKRLMLLAVVLLACNKTGQGRHALAEWSGSTTVPLIAGQHTPVGTVTASMEAGRLAVKYALDAPWTMSSSHLDVEEDWQLIPQTRRNHNPIPGHFELRADHAPAVTEYLYQKEISWEPGATLYIAAHAEVASPEGQREGAWAAGTRFTAQGNWATYFTFTPTVQEVEAGGDGWVLVHFSGTTTDGTNQTFNDRLYMLHGEEGLAGAPLPAGIREDLAEDDPAEDDMVFVSQTIVDEIVASEQAGALTPALQAIAEPEDPPPPSSSPGPMKLFGKCRNKAFTKKKTLDLGKDISVWEGELGENVDAKIGIGGNIQGAATYDAHMEKKRYAIFGICVPYGVKYKDVHVWGSASVNSGATLTGTVKYSDHWKRQLAKPHLDTLIFMIGPVPVLIGVNLPITAGVDLSATVSASLTYNGGRNAVGSFDYTCVNGDGCTGTSDYQSLSSNPESITGGLSGQVKPSIWVDVSVGLYLYKEQVLYLKLGVRPYAHGDLWGYTGNNCGDADEDGDFETVDALTFDLDWEVAVNGGVSLLGKKEKQWKLWSKRGHIKLWDLIGSSALSPMLHGPASATVGQAAPYAVLMRPCWPYKDEVKYRLDWGDTLVDSLSGKPPGWIPASHAWQQAGTMAVGLKAIEDEHGRDLGETTYRTVTVTGASTGTWTGWLNRDNAGGVGDFETLADFLQVGKACPHPIDIRCQTLTGVDWTQTGQVYTCNTTVGGVCRNDQNSRPCLDYRVNFLCP
jgi:hypothetical protein